MGDQTSFLEKQSTDSLKLVYFMEFFWFLEILGELSMCVLDCFFSTHAQKSENKVISNGGPSFKSDILHNLQQYKTVAGILEMYCLIR